jgi:hypothetical protein
LQGWRLSAWRAEKSRKNVASPFSAPGRLKKAEKLSPASFPKFQIAK